MLELYVFKEDGMYVADVFSTPHPSWLLHIMYQSHIEKYTYF